MSMTRSVRLFFLGPLSFQTYYYFFLSRSNGLVGRPEAVKKDALSRRRPHSGAPEQTTKNSLFAATVISEAFP